MNRAWQPGILIAVAVAALFCTRSEAVEPPAAADAAEVLDATVVDADHYKVEFENERVRVVRIKYGPGEESVMHSHPDHVAVFLTDLDAEFRMPDGTTEEVHGEAGTQIFVPGGAHHPRNNGDEPFEALAIEVKPAGPGEGSPAVETGPDPTEVDADHYKAVFENDRVRVIRVGYGPGEESVMHYHPDHVAVFLSDQQFGFTAPDGSTQEMQFEAGGHILAPAGQHRPKNLLEEAAEVVLVELK